MNILIMGAGEVGKGLSKRLSSEGHQVKVIDIDPSVLEDLETHVDVMGMEGNGACASLQLDAGVKEMDLFIGVSDNDERNMIACSIAKQFGVKTTIARVRSDEYIFPDRSYYATSMGIDLIINPDEVASVELFDLLENPAAVSVADFASGRLKLVGIIVKKESIVCSRTLSDWPELGLDKSMLAAAVVRDGEAFIPRGDTCLLVGDRVFVIAAPSALDSVNKIGDIQNRELKKVVLVGASRVSFFLAERLEKAGTRILIIDKDEKRCRWFAEELESATILFGDGRDISILKEAGVDDADGFISASQDDETNILSALLAKEQGAKRVITLMRKPQYIPLMEHIKPIDVAINPRLVTINAIMRYVRQGRIITMASLAAEQAEAIEYEISAESPLIGRPLKEGFLPREVLLGAIVRDDEIIIPRGDDTLQPQDHIVVIALKKSISDIDNLLSENGPATRWQKLFQSISKTVSP